MELATAVHEQVQTPVQACKGCKAACNGCHDKAHCVQAHTARGAKLLCAMCATFHDEAPTLFAATWVKADAGSAKADNWRSVRDRWFQTKNGA